MHESHRTPPFHAVVSTREPNVLSPVPADLVAEPLDDELTAEAIEDAYRRALEVAESVALEGAIGPAAIDEPPTSATGTEPADAKSGATATAGQVAAQEQPRVTPRQVLEALLFVGGQPLTGKRLADLLGEGFTSDLVDDLIAGLNEQYLSENRPYEVRLSEGGYRMALRPEFERIRDRVYGLGPKDVKLSQDALEMLALVAYQQPVSREDVEATGKPHAAALMRQLLRRELISLERGEGGTDDVRYHTTPRFLQLFGLGSLDDLPQAEDLVYK